MNVFLNARENIMKPLENKINDFTSYFQSAIREISEIQEIRIPDVLKNTLYIVVLDGLSKSVYPEEGTHRARFVKFILKYGNWSGGNNVSLPHLKKLLYLFPDKAFEDLRDYVIGKMSSWMRGQPVFLENDPSFNEVSKLWPRDENNVLLSLGGWKLENLQHYHLLYAYRNYLVHEFTRIGWTLDELAVHKPIEPYYQHAIDATNLQAPEHHWVLSYPKNFYIICVNNP